MSTKKTSDFDEFSTQQHISNLMTVTWPKMIFLNSRWQTRHIENPLLPVPNITAHPSTASVPVTVLLYDGPLLCGFNGYAAFAARRYPFRYSPLDDYLLVGQGQEYGLVPVFKFSLRADLPRGYLQGARQSHVFAAFRRWQHRHVVIAYKFVYSKYSLPFCTKTARRTSSCWK